MDSIQLVNVHVDFELNIKVEDPKCKQHTCRLPDLIAPDFSRKIHFLCFDSYII